MTLTGPNTFTGGVTVNFGGLTGVFFATHSGAGTSINAYTAASNLPASVTNSNTIYKVDGSQTVTGQETVNSLRINSTGASQSLSIGANNLTISLAGLLFVGSNDYTINGTTGEIANGTSNASLLLSHLGTGVLRDEARTEIAARRRGDRDAGSDEAEGSRRVSGRCEQSQSAGRPGSGSRKAGSDEG